MINTIVKEAVIIGGGPAGLSAACELRKQGVADIVILEREAHLGGILRQCIHDGFGLVRFKESLSGPEYANRFIKAVKSNKIEFHTNTTVLDISNDKMITAVSRNGLIRYHAKVIILAMGCRERTRGALSIPGTRPAGVYTAGVAQAYINLKNTMIGKTSVILGSGDIGLIMARRLTLEGVTVKGVFELKPYPNGLSRNIEQCLNDFNIPLYTSHTVTQIKGKNRLESVVVNKVDERLSPIQGTEQEYACDTLILSVGLIPENELSRKAGVAIDPSTNGPIVDEFCQTSIPGIFAAGNVLHVHDLVDFVSIEAETLGKSAARFLNGTLPESNIKITAERGIAHSIPQYISGTETAEISFRVTAPRKNATISFIQDGKLIKSAYFKKLLPAEMNKVPIDPQLLISTKEIRMVIQDA